MKLFRVFNGYYGSAALSILVIAENRASALKLARPIFHNTEYDSSNFVELQTELIFEHCNTPQCSGLMEYR